MAETPDFDQIARQIVISVQMAHEAVVVTGAPLEHRPLFAHQVAEQLRLVWNARGVADANLFAHEDDHRDILERITTLDR